VISGGKGTAADKFAALEAARVTTVRSPAELGSAIARRLGAKRKAGTGKAKVARKPVKKLVKKPVRASVKKPARRKSTRRQPAAKQPTARKAAPQPLVRRLASRVAQAVQKVRKPARK
jgi:hypothetical protein